MTQYIEIPVDAPDPEDLEHHLCPSCGKPEGWMCSLGGYSSENREETSVSYHCASCDHQWVETKVYMEDDLAQYRQHLAELKPDANGLYPGMTAVSTKEVVAGCVHAAVNHPSPGCRDISALGAAYFTAKKGARA